MSLPSASAVNAGRGRWRHCPPPPVLFYDAGPEVCPQLPRDLITPCFISTIGRGAWNYRRPPQSEENIENGAFSVPGMTSNADRYDSARTLPYLIEWGTALVR